MTERIIDTNVFLRYLLRDVESLYQKARKFITSLERGKASAKVSILVLDELIWAFEKYYFVKREEFIPKLLKLLAFKNIKIVEAKKEVILRILEKMNNSRIDFTDFYLSEIATKETIFSFDRDFKKLFR